MKKKIFNKILFVLLFSFMFCFAGAGAINASAEQRIPEYEDITQMTEEQIAIKEADFLERAKEANESDKSKNQTVTAIVVSLGVGLPLIAAGTVIVGFAITKKRKRQAKTK